MTGECCYSTSKCSPWHLPQNTPLLYWFSSMPNPKVTWPFFTESRFCTIFRTHEKAELNLSPLCCPVFTVRSQGLETGSAILELKTGCPQFLFCELRRPARLQRLSEWSHTEAPQVILGTKEKSDKSPCADSASNPFPMHKCYSTSGKISVHSISCVLVYCLQIRSKMFWLAES